MNTIRKTTLASMAAVMAFAGFATVAHAQRDPAYAAARTNGSIGEQTDGYLGIVGDATPDLQRLVNSINIRRRAVYTDRAESNGATIEAYATTAGCQAISRTVPGEKYQAPDGSWQTRTEADPERLPICP